MTRGQAAAVLILAAGAAVLTGALVWIGGTTLRLEAAETEARRLAVREEKARLALWRLDSALTAVIGRENARPAERFTEAGAKEADTFAHRRFEVDPQPRQKTAAEPGPPISTPQPEQSAAPPTAQTQQSDSTPVRAPAEARALQSQLNTSEFQQRARNASEQASFIPPNDKPPPSDGRPEPAHAQSEPQPPPVEVPSSIVPPMAAPEPEPQDRRRSARTARPARVEPSRVETTFQPVWIAGELYLVRRVRERGTVRLQTLWIDWPALRRHLLGQVRDLLPGADLQPVPAGETADPGRLLALLPVRLLPGSLPPPAPPRGLTPARLTLAAGSGAIAIAGLAVAALLLGSLRQSQRRADFVSAVTHELRTPLTTVRMYSEMLSEGMVPAGKQSDYLSTLRTEAERLGHLVENVLAYARLERSSEPGEARIEVLGIDELLAGMAGRLNERAARDGFSLVVDTRGDGPADQVEVDPAALERILFNWIDNACKYAAEAADRRLEIRLSRRGRSMVLRLADHGPGISRSDRKRIFRPFHKSAARAAASAPGVGLGLALSRRLARSLGGDLRLAESVEGAVFELVLRSGERE